MVEILEFKQTDEIKTGANIVLAIMGLTVVNSTFIILLGIYARLNIRSSIESLGRPRFVLSIPAFGNTQNVMCYFRMTHCE